MRKQKVLIEYKQKYKEEGRAVFIAANSTEQKAVVLENYIIRIRVVSVMCSAVHILFHSVSECARVCQSEPLKNQNLMYVSNCLILR